MIAPAVFLTSVIGWSLTNLLVNGTLFDPIRNYCIVKSPILSKLLTCIQCSGFWVGAILGYLAFSEIIYNILFYVIPNQGLWYSLPITVFLYGVFNSGISVLINSVLIFLHSFIKGESDDI